MTRLRWQAVVLTLVVGTVAAGQKTWAAEAESGEKIYKKTLLSTVWVWVPIGGNKASTGTGSLIDVKSRLILTNYHVVKDREAAFVMFPIMEKGAVVPERDVYLKRGRRVKGKVIARDSKRDLALIQLESVPEGAKPLYLAQQSPSPGQQVHSIGNPGGSEALWVYTPGSVRQVYHSKFMTGGKDGEDGFQVDARIVATQSAVNPGDSGGPVVNDRGELVAVVQGHRPDTQARLVSIFIDVTEVRALLASKGLSKVVHAPKESPPPAKEVQTSASEPPPAKEKPEEDAAAKAEKDASRKLKLAKMLQEGGKIDSARARYQDIIKTYPKTKAAEEARQLLDKIKD
jgi:S1-C subfamily serine protease